MAHMTLEITMVLAELDPMTVLGAEGSGSAQAGKETKL